MVIDEEGIEKEVYVAHFDILGMGAILEKDSWEAWQNILLLSEAQDNQELPISDRERGRLKERFFSDTILTATPGTT